MRKGNGYNQTIVTRYSSGKYPEYSDFKKKRQNQLASDWCLKKKFFLTPLLTPPLYKIHKKEKNTASDHFSDIPNPGRINAYEHSTKSVFCPLNA